MLIDKQGRLFGKINIIDFFVIALLISIIPMALFPQVIFRKKKTIIIMNQPLIDIEVEAKVINCPPDLIGRIAVGDKELDNKGNVIGEVLYVGDPSSTKYTFILGPQDKTIVTDPTLKEVPVKLRLKVPAREEVYPSYNGQKVSVNSPFIFTTPKYSVKVALINDTLPLPEEWVHLQVKFMTLSPEINTVLNEGDIEKDQDGRIVGKLTKIESSVPTQVLAVKLEENKFVLVSDPLRKDIIADLELLCSEREGGLFFNNFQIKIGSWVTFSSDLYTVSGLITQLKKQ
jgi:hypothetical protein